MSKLSYCLHCLHNYDKYIKPMEDFSFGAHLLTPPPPPPTLLLANDIFNTRLTRHLLSVIYHPSISYN